MSLRADLEAVPHARWPVLRRVRYTLVYGSIFAVFMGTCQSFYVRGGLYVGKSGTELAPVSAMLLGTAGGCLLGAAVFGMLLPLYRYRFGGYLIGPAVAAATLAPQTFVPDLAWRPRHLTPTWEWWLVGFVLVFMTGQLAQLLRDDIIRQDGAPDVA